MKIKLDEKLGLIIEYPKNSPRLNATDSVSTLQDDDAGHELCDMLNTAYMTLDDDFDCKELYCDLENPTFERIIAAVDHNKNITVLTKNTMVSRYDYYHMIKEFNSGKIKAIASILVQFKREL